MVIEGRQLQQGDSVVFRPVDSDSERSGQFWGEEPSCGVTVFGWADGRRYWVAHRNIRAETEYERQMRERDGYYAEDLIGRAR